MKKTLVLIAVATILGACKFKDPGDQIVIDASKKGAALAPSMYGVFFEEINNAGDGGLYAELVKNRSFEELEMPEGYRAEGEKLIPKPVVNHSSGKVESQYFKWTKDEVPGWSLANPSQAEMVITKENPLFDSAPNNLKLTIKQAQNPVQLINSGYWGMGIHKNEAYQLRAIIRPDFSYKGKVIAKLISENNTVLTTVNMGELKAGEWNDINLVLIPTESDSRARLILEFNSTGKLWIDYVSLFPENTFQKRKNGLRKDVAEFLVGLQPSFVRWPGGCVVEGISLENRFEWKKTLGDPAARSGEYSTWGYRNTYGFGYYEFLQFCEDIGADGMYVCNVGMGCQYRMGDACSDEEVEYYLNDCLDAIEYAIGSENTTWGAKRVAEGHQKPFPLKYVEIGNENWGELYDERFDIFYAAIKKKYPDLVLISNHGIEGTGKIKQTDMVDPHWYVSPDFFFANSTIFDKLDRDNYKVYVGEYACNKGVGAGSMTAALSEAAFITGMERNSDLVTMTSYAPLLENQNNRVWPVNLIWLDTDRVVGRSSYYVQKISAENKPDYNLEMSRTMSLPQPENIPAGAVGLGTWSTKVEFKDIKIISGERVIKPHPNDYSTQRGAWDVSSGVLSQNSMQQATFRVLNGFSGNDFTLEFKARKLDGKEGFFIYFGMNNNNREGYVFNVAGWENTTTTVQKVISGSPSGSFGEQVEHSIETDKWYNVKVKIKADRAELFIDDELVLAYNNQSVPMQFYASGYDEKNHEIILKVVNASNSVYPGNFILKGVSGVDGNGRVITLSAKNGEQENSFDEPQKIFPKESEITGVTEKIAYNFEPFSYTIIRIKAAI